LTAGTPPVAVPAKGVPGQVNFKGGSGAAKIAGLTALMAAFGAPADLNAPAIPLVKGVGFMGGDILLGGPGSDLLEGKGGDDLIDGDVWLNVQLRAVLNDGTAKLVDGPRLLVDDVFSDPQRLNPGNISIVRSIVTPVTPPADCGSPAPLNCDTAVYNFPRAEYDITANANGTVTVTDVPLLRAVAAHLSEGTDTLRNIEQLQYSDMTIPVPVFVATAIVPNVIGLIDTAAAAAITAVGLQVGATRPRCGAGRVDRHDADHRGDGHAQLERSGADDQQSVDRGGGEHVAGGLCVGGRTGSVLRSQHDRHPHAEQQRRPDVDQSGTFERAARNRGSLVGVHAGRNVRHERDGDAEQS